jgi:hypothetical protein
LISGSTGSNSKVRKRVQFDLSANIEHSYQQTTLPEDLSPKESVRQKTKAMFQYHREVQKAFKLPPHGNMWKRKLGQYEYELLCKEEVLEMKKKVKLKMWKSRCNPLYGYPGFSYLHANVIRQLELKKKEKIPGTTGKRVNFNLPVKVNSIHKHGSIHSGDRILRELPAGRGGGKEIWYPEKHYKRLRGGVPLKRFLSPVIRLGGLRIQEFGYAGERGNYHGYGS